MSDLDRLFYWHGIAADFYNYRGEFVHVPIENRSTLLATMGIDVDSPEKVAEAAFNLDVAPWLQWFPALVLERAGEHSGFEINLHPSLLEKEFNWELIDEQGTVITGSFRPANEKETGDYVYEGERYSRRKVYIRGLAPNYYQLRVSLENVREESTTLAIAPNTAFTPEFSAQGKNCWGVIVQLYTLRSHGDWGIGDFTVLKSLVSKLSEFGADTIGLNPLHSLLSDLDHKFSPYSPSDRRFLCSLYIDPEIEPEYELVVAAESEDDTSLRLSKIQELRASDKVLYREVADLKYAFFEKMFSLFLENEIKPETNRGKQFIQYCEKLGDVLKVFSLYEGVNNRWSNAKNYIDIDRHTFEETIASGDWAQLLDGREDVVLFHSYLQWVGHCQLGQVQQQAKDEGMRIGLIRDLAVGADGGGAEAVGNPLLFCRGASVGAPPDPLAAQGQNWGIPPMDPAGLRRTGFKHYINLLRENMSLCGALRIDHAMSMMRLWWCPPGKTAEYGAYVYYPFEEMIGLLALESERNNCMVIGEDLGVVPDEFRHAMRLSHIYSNKVFYFEKPSFDQFRKPSEYEPKALAMINNHDVPTLVSWWNGSDLDLRNKLNIFEEGVSYEQMIEQRAAEKHQMLNLLEECGELPEKWRSHCIDEKADQALIFSVLATGAKTASEIFVIQLEDLLMMDAPVNVPGTYLEHPNWQRKLTKTVAEIFEPEHVSELLRKIDKTRLI